MHLYMEFKEAEVVRDKHTWEWVCCYEASNLVYLRLRQKYKLRIMVIKIDDPVFVFGDNNSVLYNTAAPATALKKKPNAIVYHFVWECVTHDEWQSAYVNTDDKVAGLFTKPLMKCSSDGKLYL